MTSPRSERELFDFEKAELANFEAWDRAVHAPAGQGKSVAYVSVRVGGVVGLNKAAQEMLGSPEAVRVMFDPHGKRLGLLPADEEDRTAYKLGFGQAQVSCKRLFDYYGLVIAETRRYHDPRMIDGILVVDL